MKTLPSALAHLCNRLAAEEMKAETWKLGQALREEYRGRLATGEGVAELEADMHRRVAQAALAQFRLTIAPQRARRASESNASRPPTLTS